MTVITSSIATAGQTCLSMVSSRKADSGNEQVDQLDADERNDDAAEAIDQKIAAQQAGGADRTIGNAAQRQRDQGDNDQCIEDDRRQDGALGRMKLHDVERLQGRVKR